MNEQLINKYRPVTLDQIQGQDAVVKSLRELLKNPPHAFLFYSNIPGNGKTSLARIIASELKCEKNNIIEIAASDKNGIDDMRVLQEAVKLPGFGDNKTKIVILDEAHRVGSQAWDSMLKIFEEPPKHLYWVICTTDISKVPKTIVSRCKDYFLKDVSEDDLIAVVEFIAGEEQIFLPKNASILIAKESRGSVRNAISALEKCVGTTTIDEVAELLGSAIENKNVLDLCRMLADPTKFSWKKFRKVADDIRNLNPYSIKVQVMGYFTSAVLNSRDINTHFFGILKSFDKPVDTQTGFAVILLNCYEIFQKNM